jgi:hypothetical protein
MENKMFGYIEEEEVQLVCCAYIEGWSGFPESCDVAIESGDYCESHIDPSSHIQLSDEEWLEL